MLAVVTRGEWESISGMQVSICVLFLPKPFAKRKYGNVSVPIMDRNESNCAPRNTEARKITVDVHVDIFAIRHDAPKRTSICIYICSGDDLMCGVGSDARMESESCSTVSKSASQYVTHADASVNPSILPFTNPPLAVHTATTM